MGAFVDKIGQGTAARKWLWFLTLTFRTRHFPWGRGFSIQQPKPSADFAHRFFAEMISWMEGQLHTRVQYFVADQFGETGGRFHMHCGLSWPGLFEFRWKAQQQMLWDGTGAESIAILRQGAGFSRILPWEEDAGYYIGRYIGRDAARCEWDFGVGSEPIRTSPALIGRDVIAGSPDLPSNEFRRTFHAWHR